MELRLRPFVHGGFGIAVAALLVAACSNASDAPPTILDACTMLETDAAAAIVGEAVTPTPIESAAATRNGVSMCNYLAPTLHNGFLLTVGPHALTDLAASAAAEMAQNLQSADEALPGTNAQTIEIDRLGEAAYALTTDIYIQIYAYKGPYRVLVNRNVAPSAAMVEATTELARLAVDALP